MNITCPNKKCGQQHNLFWLVRKGGKKEVCYRCSRVEQWNRQNNKMKFRTRDILWPEADQFDKTVLSLLPEVVTSSRKKELLLKRQLQLVMLYENESGS